MTHKHALGTPGDAVTSDAVLACLAETPGALEPHTPATDLWPAIELQLVSTRIRPVSAHGRTAMTSK